MNKPETFEIAGDLWERLLEDNSRWKYPWLKEICELCAEYMTLQSLLDATRAAHIPDMILDIAEKELKGART